MRDYDWTLYPHNLRVGDSLPIIAFDPETEKEKIIDELQGPSLTFAGFPQVEAEDFERLFEEAQKLEYDESRYQPVILSVIGEELEGSYFGPNTGGGHSILQGLRSLLEPTFPESEVKELLALTDNNYLLYNQEFYDFDLEHVDEFVERPGKGEPPVAPVGEKRLGAQDHSLENGWRTLNVIPVADDTVYNPDTNTWLYSN